MGVLLRAVRPTGESAVWPSVQPTSRPLFAWRRWGAAAVLAGVALAAALPPPAWAGPVTPAAPLTATRAGAARASDLPSSRNEAARFLSRASFGPSSASIDALMSQGYSDWINRQFMLPATSHRAYWEARDMQIRQLTPSDGAGQDQVWESFWRQAVNGEDQLRLRMAYALSQIFVISAVDANVGGQPRAMAAWLDMLGANAFGSYRSLLEQVALHPLMGLYLSHARNQKPDPATGRVPDQNFARELMQLFSIGVVRLAPDGRPLLVNGNPVEAYGPADVTGLSHVFTGFSFACPGSNDSCFFFGHTGSGDQADPDRYFKRMQAYPQYHSTVAKSFLGVTIAAQATPDPLASLRGALDTLAAHPNVGPFMARQLIQRLVTSNPSPTYVRDVAAVFDNNGSGQRGDLKAVVRAILLHPQAQIFSPTLAKVREPVLRLSAYLRAFPHTSDSGAWRVGNTDDPNTSLGQTPLRAPSVFNFYRPGYMPAGTQSAAAGLGSPEMQIINESSVAGWVNFMRDNLSQGVGQIHATWGRRDLQRNWASEMALAEQPAALTAAVVDKLLYGQASAMLSSEVAAAVGKISIPAFNPARPNQPVIDATRLNRVRAAVLLVLASPEFLAAK
jgi:uncharacterized protein (DUF1800 family)